MINSLHRFHGHTALSFVYKQGQTVRGAQLSLKYAINQRRTSYRVAIVVSRKVDKSAVVRNRIRRRIYAIVRDNATNIQTPYDLVFTAFSNQIAEADMTELQQLVQEQLKKAGVITSVKSPSHAIVKPKDTE